MKKRFLSIFITLFAIPLVSCGKDSSPVLEETHIWSLPSTVKYKLDQKPSSYNLDLSIYMLKNETDSVQLMITPNVDTVYDVKVSDLRCGNSKISKNDITIYREHYTYLNSIKNQYSEIGYYPDAIVPLELSKQYKENFIKKGQNQGVLIQVKTNEDTVAGLYEGEVAVYLNEKVEILPFKVEVDDLCLPTTHYGKKAYAIWDKEFEYAYSKNNKEEREEYTRRLYELLVDYAVMPTSLPNVASLYPNYSSKTLNEKVDDVISYGSRIDINSICLPYTVDVVNVSGYGPYSTANFSEIEQELRMLVEASSNENNIISKLYLYISLLDEQRPETYWKVIDSNRRFKEVKEKILNDKELFVGKEEVRSALSDIQHIVTLTQTELLYANDDPNDVGLYSACPLYNLLDNGEYLYTMQKRMAKGNKYWWYGCTNPIYPYVSYQIDDFLIAQRMQSWQQKYFGIDGELYWSTNVSSMYQNIHDAYTSHDPWIDGTSSFGSGDGWLTYPGSRYNTLDCFASLRLNSIRDGQEDYDLLSILEQELAVASFKYGLDLSLTDYISDVYSTMINGAKYSFDYTLVENAKREIVSLIKALRSNANALIVSSKNVKTNMTNYEVYTTYETEVKIDNYVIPVTREAKFGEVHCFSIKNGNFAEHFDISLKNSGSTTVVNKTIGSTLNFVEGFDYDNYSEIENRISLTRYNGHGIISSLNFDPQFVDSGASLKIETEYVDRLSYKPLLKFQFNEDDVGVDFSGFSYLRLDIYNDSDYDEIVSIKITDDNGTTNIGYIILSCKKWNRINRLIFPEVDMSSISEIRFEFNNNSYNTKYYIDNIALSKGGY